MKHFIILILVSSLYISCEYNNPTSIKPDSSDSSFTKTENSWINDTLENIENAEASLQKWNNLKTHYGTTYKYYYNDYCGPDIFDNTYVLIENNKVKEAISIYSKQIKTENSFYWEPFDTIYSSLDSNSTIYSNYKTVDQIFNITINKILVQDPDSNDIYIDFHKNGLIRLSYYWHEFMADAPNVKVQIDSLFFGEIK